MNRRVVVTGMGCVTPLGNTLTELWENLINCQSGIGKITHFDASGHLTQIAAEVKDFDPLKYIHPADLKKMDLFAQYAIYAAMEAFADSGLGKKLNKNRLGTIIGNGIGGLKTLEENISLLLKKGPRMVSPYLIQSMITNSGAGNVAILLEAKGPSCSITTACASGSHSIGIAAMFIKYGMSEVMIAGGADAAITPAGIASFNKIKALSKNNDNPAKASRSFDLNRDGFVMGEGAGILILEELEHAKDRKARIYAELTGFGCTTDGDDMVSLKAEGIERCMSEALNDAWHNRKIKYMDIDYINAHATSTDGDRIEAKAIERTLLPPYVPVSSTKPSTGHLLGAAGAVEAIITIMAINNNIAPPNCNLDNPDPECSALNLVREPLEVSINHALTNSFGFGGHNSTLIFSRYKD
jgi:3-oxoacyl-[acyl-carrier-protein] synthase II